MWAAARRAEAGLGTRGTGLRGLSRALSPLALSRHPLPPASGERPTSRLRTRTGAGKAASFSAFHACARRSHRIEETEKANQ